MDKDQIREEKRIKDLNSIKCQHLLNIVDKSGKETNGCCSIASTHMGFPVKALHSLCGACQESDNPMTYPNVGITNTISYTQTKKEREAIKNGLLSVEDRFGAGPGTELHKMIPAFLENPGCNCKKWAKKMNIWGPDKCELNMEAIVDKLVSESKKRTLFAWVPTTATRTVAYNLVKTAIDRARKNEASKKHRWAVAVTTAPRKQPTLETCLDSLQIAGFNPYIFAEPGNYPALNGIWHDRTIFHEEKKGVWWNWIESCRWTLENTDANVIMTVQDDSLFHPDCMEVAEKFLWPAEDTGFVSLYTPKHYSIRNHLKSKPERPIGLNRIATKALWGACAMIWPRKVLEMVMEHELIEGWLGAPLKTKSAWAERQQKRKEEPWTIQNSDTAIGKIMNWTGRSMWFMDPSPVQHIAKYSAIKHGGNEGRRNCGRCAKYSEPLDQQVPFHINGQEDFKIFDENELSI
jgi:hypothetical protein